MRQISLPQTNLTYAAGRGVITCRQQLVSFSRQLCSRRAGLCFLTSYWCYVTTKYDFLQPYSWQNQSLPQPMAAFVDH